MTAILHLNKNSIPYKILRITRYNILQRRFHGITSPLRVLPDFIVIGAKRCGTTSLYYYLSEHPCIKRSSHDHLGFFDDNFHLGLQFYRSFFSTIFEKKYVESKKRKRLTYDVTSTYIYDPIAADHIFNVLSHVKIIAILRNPVDRAYSEYSENENSLKTGITFEDAIKKEIEMLERERTENNDYTASTMQKSFLAKGFYAAQLKVWFKLFPKENILILFTEDFANDPNYVFNTIFKFLNLESFSIDNPKRLQKGIYSELNSDTRAKLVEFYKLRNLQLYDMIGRNLGWEK